MRDTNDRPSRGLSSSLLNIKNSREMRHLPDLHHKKSTSNQTSVTVDFQSGQITVQALLGGSDSSHLSFDDYLIITRRQAFLSLFQHFFFVIISQLFGYGMRSEIRRADRNNSKKCTRCTSIAEKYTVLQNFRQATTIGGCFSPFNNRIRYQKKRPIFTYLVCLDCYTTSIQGEAYRKQPSGWSCVKRSGKIVQAHSRMMK